MTQKRIYLDWNATAPLLPDVRQAMIDTMDTSIGNASSIHHEGQVARGVIERARRAVARACGAPAQSVVFTAGATESNNHVLHTHVRYTPDALILASPVEHPSVLEVVEALEAQGAQVSWIPVDAQGRLDTDWMREQLTTRPVTLVSVMWANNECGNINPISVISHMTREAGAQLHVDGTQALGRFPIDMTHSGIDWMTLSFHKMGGPKGIGAILIREGLVLESLMVGGHQERGRRPGTENVVAAAGVEAAARAVTQNVERWHEELLARRAHLLGALDGHGLKYELRGDQDHHLPNTINVAFDGAGGEDLLLRLDLEGISASGGSACTAGSLEPSHVILAMGYSPQDAVRSLRLSFGPSTTFEQLDEAAARIARAVRVLQSLGG